MNNYSATLTNGRLECLTACGNGGSPCLRNSRRNANREDEHAN